MYIESSAPRKEGDYANLFSETYEINKTPLTDEYCLVFWYHMYGTGMGKHTSFIWTTSTISGTFYNFWMIVQLIDALPNALSRSYKTKRIVF